MLKSSSHCISPTKAASTPADSATAQVSLLTPCMDGDMGGRGTKGAAVALLAKGSFVLVAVPHSIPGSSSSMGASGEDQSGKMSDCSNKGGGFDGSPIGGAVKPSSKVAEDKHSHLASFTITMIVGGE